MPKCKFITTEGLQTLCAEDKAIIVDVREQDEYDREHIINARCMPLSILSKNKMADCPKDKVIVFHCQSGSRTHQAQDKLLSMGFDNVYILEGGLSAWKKSNGMVSTDKKAPLPLMRQVQIIVGFMVLLGIILSYLVSPYLNLISAFFGAGLLFAGISGYCGLAKILLILPYNKSNKQRGN